LALTPDLLEPLDIFRAMQGGISRAEAIQLLLRDGLFQLDLPAAEEKREQDSDDRLVRSAA
jgi:hypothetical protein